MKPAEVISKKKRKLLVKQKKEREKRGLRGEVLSQVLFMLHHFFDDTPLSLSHVCPLSTLLPAAAAAAQQCGCCRGTRSAGRRPLAAT